MARRRRAGAEVARARIPSSARSMEPAMSEQQRNEIIEREAPRISDDNFHKVDNRSLAPDVLKGVREITLFTDGTDDKSAIRSMYHRTLTSNTVPTFKWGSMTYA